MRDHCHRCHGELPSNASGSTMNDDSVVLFCPSCGTPQLRLQEHMRIEVPMTAAPNTTGNAPPPVLPGANPNQIDWRTAIRFAIIVAGIGAALSIFGMKSTPFSFFSVVWTVSCATITLGLYTGRRPAHKMDAKTGARIGIVAGIIMVAAVGLATATTGVILRFGTTQMVAVDRETTEQRKALQAKVVEFLEQRSQDKELASTYIAQMNSPQMNSPEMLAGSALAGGGFQALLILLLSTGGGAFTGMMRSAQTRRLGQRRD